MGEAYHSQAVDVVSGGYFAAAMRNELSLKP
jgi:hypothetical protein